MTDLRPIKHEFQRLILARGDIAAAAAAWTILNSYEELRDAATGQRSRRIEWDDAWWGVWTGAVVSYARPFTQSRQGGMTLGKRWWGQIRDEDAKVGHEWVMGFRHALWAHTDQKSSHRRVLVSRRGGSEERTTFAAPLNFQRLRRLCDYWLERLDVRIAELIAVLEAEGELPADGSPIALDRISDETLW